MTLTTKIRGAIQANLLGSNDLATPQIKIPFHTDLEWEDGTADGKADLVFADERTIAASGSEDIDLAGALSDPLGTSLTFVTLKALLIRAHSDNTNNVVVGNGGGPVAGIFGATTHTVVVEPGGIFLWASPSGITITATSADDIGVANSSSGTSVTYDIIAVGGSA